MSLVLRGVSSLFANRVLPDLSCTLRIGMRTIIAVFAALFILILVAIAVPARAQSAKLSGLSQRRNFVLQGCEPLAKVPKAAFVKMRSAGKVYLESKNRRQDVQASQIGCLHKKEMRRNGCQKSRFQDQSTSQKSL